MFKTMRKALAIPARPAVFDASDVFGALPGGFEGFDESTEPVRENAQKPMQRGDRFRVDGKGPVWNVVGTPRGISLHVQRDGQKKWFGATHDYEHGTVEVWPMSQGSGDRLGPAVVQGQAVLV